MRHRYTTPKVPLTDAQRLEELTIRVYGQVARNLLNNVAHPEIIKGSNIETHQGRYKKAINMLTNAGIIEYAGVDNNCYQTKKKYRVLDFDTKSAQYEAAPKVRTTWKEFHQKIFSFNNPDTQNEFDRLGFKDVSKLYDRNAIHVYWHKDEYQFLTDKRKNVPNNEIQGTYVYPVALEETRIKGILRALVEQHFQDDYHTKLERFLGIPAGTLDTDDHAYFSIRNFSAYSAHLTHDKFFGTKGFMDEYRTNLKYMQAMLHNLEKFERLVQFNGGFEGVVAQMRKDSISQILEDSPLTLGLTTDPDVIKTYPKYSQEHKDSERKFRDTFVLRNSGYFNYDSLYDTDTSIEYLDNSEHEYRHDEERQRIIDVYEKEVEPSPCTPKTT